MLLGQPLISTATTLRPELYVFVIVILEIGTKMSYSLAFFLAFARRIRVAGGEAGEMSPDMVNVDLQCRQ